MKVICNYARQAAGRWLNNRTVNSQQPCQLREKTMAKFSSPRTLQKVFSAHASVHNHLNQERHLLNPQTFKLTQTTALAEWYQFAA